MSRRSTGLLLAVILLVAATLRIAGIRFGLPDVFNPDEIAIMSRALAFGKGDLNPHNFLYPTLYFYVLFAWVGAYFVLAWMTGAVASLQAFQASFFTDPTGIYLAGRSLGVVCGVACVWFTYRIGARLFNRAAGIVAAVFLAIAPVAVRDSHYVKHDIPVTLAVLAATLLLARAWGFHAAERGDDARPPSRQDRAGLTSLLLAAGVSGVAFSTHYYAVFLALPLATAAVLQAWRQGTTAVVRRLVLAGAVMLAVFLLCSPFLLVEWSTAWRDIVANRQIVVDRALPTGGTGAKVARYASMLLFEAAGWPVALFALGGGIWLLRREPLKALFLLLFPLAFLAFITNTVPATRYLNPVLPFVALLAGFAVTTLLRGLPAGPSRIVLPLVVLLGAAPGFVESVRNDRLFRQADTRTLAREFVEHRLPNGSTVLLQSYSVVLNQSHASLREALELHLGSLARVPTKFALRLSASERPPAYRTLYLGSGLDQDRVYVRYDQLGDGTGGLAVLRRLGVQYVVLKQYNVREPATEPLRDALGREGRLMATFSPYRSSVEAPGTVAPFLHNTDAIVHPALERPGPVVEVWQLDDSPPPA